MEDHFIFTDSTFEDQFANCSLKPELFTHEAHLRLAWIHVTNYGADAAIENISTQLIKFVDFVEAGSKYNHTLTVAAVKAVAHFIGKSSSDNFKDFIAEFPRLKFNFRDLINFHYSANIFNSTIARNTFVEPDLAPFD